jgi:hypothetical protein
VAAVTELIHFDYKILSAAIEIGAEFSGWPRMAQRYTANNNKAMVLCRYEISLRRGVGGLGSY